MTSAIGAFMALTLSFAACLLLYAANVRLVAAGATGSRSARWSRALVAPLSAWQLGARLLPLAFAASALIYVAVWASLYTLGVS